MMQRLESPYAGARRSLALRLRTGKQDLKIPRHFHQGQRLLTVMPACSCAASPHQSPQPRVHRCSIQRE